MWFIQFYMGSEFRITEENDLVAQAIKGFPTPWIPLQVPLSKKKVDSEELTQKLLKENERRENARKQKPQP